MAIFPALGPCSGRPGQSSQGSAWSAVRPGVASSFAEVLASVLGESPMAGKPTQTFEDALRAFEASLRLAPTVFEATPRAQPAWAAELGVELSCTAEDLKRAFRRLAFKTHPDRQGGSHEAFLRATALLEEALRAHSAEGVPSRPTVARAAGSRYGRVGGARPSGASLNFEA